MHFIHCVRFRTKLRTANGFGKHTENAQNIGMLAALLESKLKKTFYKIKPAFINMKKEMNVAFSHSYFPNQENPLLYHNTRFIFSVFLSSFNEVMM